MKKYTFIALFLSSLLTASLAVAQTGQSGNNGGGLNNTGGGSGLQQGTGGNNSHLLLEDDGRASIYPNPSTDGKFTVDLSYSAERIAVYNTVGQAVNANVQMRSGNRSATVDLTGNNPGIYFVRITANGRTEVQRVIVR
jgi:hypothetical protein